MGDREIRGSSRAMIRKLALSLAGVLTIVCASWTAPAWAWGAYGHRTVAAIALQNVSPITRAHITKLLKKERAMGTPQCPIRSLEDAAVWPDCVKAESWRWAFTSPWHYQNIPVCGAFDAKINCAHGNCVSAQLERNVRILADRSLPAAQRLEALIFVTHFVGDMHQPLHVGDNHDQGGNAVKSVSGVLAGMNLHAIWDTAMAEKAISSAQPPLVRRYNAQEKAELATGKPEDWLRESWQISRDFLYPQVFGGTLPCDLASPIRADWPDSAVNASLPIIEKRIEQAGLRLAALLDKTLD